MRGLRHAYTALLSLYPKAFRERFAEPMAQTFADLVRRRATEDKGLLGCVLWIVIDTCAGIAREHLAATNMKKDIARIALVTAGLLLVPLIAMQFTAEVNWTFFDFVVAGVLLFGAGLAYRLVARTRADFTYRAAVGLAVAASLFLVWANLAVGLIGAETNPANLAYFAVIGVGLIGALAAGFRPRGMANAMLAMAAVQAAIGVMTLFAGYGNASDPPQVIVGANGLFIALFVGSAVLFRLAAQRRS